MPPTRPMPLLVVPVLITLALGLAPSRADAADDIRIDEFNITCVNGFSNAAFVELVANGPGQVYDNSIKLRFLNSNGTTRYEMPIGVTALAGQSWPQARRWLIGYTNFFGTTQVPPDAEMTNVPATSGAVLLVRGTGSGAAILDRVDYVNNGVVPAPTLGRSLQRQVDLSWLIKTAPDPTTAAGVTAAAASCYQASNLSARVNELALLCRNGLTSGQFIELTANSSTANRDPSMRLRTYDRSGVLLTELLDLFGASAGQVWSNGSDWLFAPASMKGPQGQAPDRLLPVPLDTLAGRVLFTRLEANGAETVLSDVRYGTPTLPRPGYGKSLSYSSGYSENPLPTPKASSGLTHADPTCERPLPSTFYLAEVQLQCSDGSAGTQFIELGVVGADERLWSDLVIDVHDRDDQPIGTLTDLFGSSSGQPWASTKRWLLATAGFADAQQRQANTMLPLGLDPIGGRLILRDLQMPAGSQIVGELRYGAGGVAVPQPGHSLQRSGPSFLEQSSPTPMGFSGLTYTDATCGRAPGAVSVREAQIRCANGAVMGQFIELVPNINGEIFDPRVQLVIRDHAGAVLHRMTHPFGARSGLAWPADRPWLIATASYTTTEGSAADLLLPVELDTLGGRIELVQSLNGPDVLLHALPYGMEGIALPAFGRSLMASGSTFIESPPTPIGYSLSAYAPDPACGMPFQSGLLLEEVQLRCLNGLSDGQFIELRSTLMNDLLDARHRVRAYDRLGLLIGEVGLTTSSSGVSAGGIGGRFLIANPIWSNGNVPDMVLPFTLDVVAGRIELLGPLGASNTAILGTLSYGHPGELTVSPGVSFLRVSGDNYDSNPTPTANGRTGGVYSAGRCSSPAISDFAISEIGTSCFPGGDASFIELRSGNLAYHDAVTLLVRDHLGNELAQLSGLFGAYTGLAWPSTRRWLIWNERFATANGLSAATLPTALDPAGGTVVLRQVVFDELVTVDSVSYGPTHEAPAPTPGMSITRPDLTGPFTLSYPTPTHLNQAVVGAACFDPTQWPIRIAQFSTACPNGGLGGQFIELTSLGSGFSYFSSLRLRLHDAAGTLLGESAQPFRQFTDKAWPQGGTFLVGHVNADDCPQTFDSFLPAALDTVGGRIELVAVMDGLEVVLQSLAYGTGQPLPAPPPGQSLERQPDASYALNAHPAPKNRSGTINVFLSCDLAIPPVRIERFAFSCASGHSVGQFIELRATSTFTIKSGLSVYITLPSGGGGELQLPASLLGRTWTAGSSFLLTNTLWPTHLGRCSDATFSEMNRISGKLSVVERVGSGCIRYLDEVTYGPGQMVSVPPPGVGVRRDSLLGFVHDPWPVPTCSSGDTTWLVPCLSADPRQTVVINEFSLFDASHNRRNQFIELTSSGAGQLSDKRVGVRTYDSNGVLIQDLDGTNLYPFQGLWRPGVPHLLLNPASLVPGGIVDRVLTPLDTLGGRIELMYTPYSGPRQTLLTLSYGPGGDIPTPGPGYSAQRMPDGSYLTTARPTPANVLGPLDMASYPVAGCEIASLVSSTLENEPVGTPTFDRLQLIAPTRNTFDKTRGTVSSSAGPGMIATTTAVDRYTLQAPAGTIVNVIARMRGVTSLLCDSTGCAQGATTYALILNGVLTIQALNSAGPTTVDVPIALSAGAPIILHQRVAAEQFSGPGFTRRVFADAQLEFVGVPAGMRITSCSGYFQDQPVPVLLALAEAVAAADHARLVWRVDQSASFEARVQRREEGSEWLDLGTVQVDGTGQLEFTDRSVLPLHRYGYRLAWTDPVSGTITAGEAWLDITRAFAFALHGARPNPSRGALSVSFQLATEGDVQVELIDIAGRRAFEHRVDRMAPGDHLLSIARPGQVAPGVYVLRLHQGERSATTRVIVTR